VDLDFQMACVGLDFQMACTHTCGRLLGEARLPDGLRGLRLSDCLRGLRLSDGLHSYLWAPPGGTEAEAPWTCGAPPPAPAPHHDAAAACGCCSPQACPRCGSCLPAWYLKRNLGRQKVVAVMRQKGMGADPHVPLVQLPQREQRTMSVAHVQRTQAQGPEGTVP